MSYGFWSYNSHLWKTNWEQINENNHRKRLLFDLKNVKFLKENIGENLCETRLGKVFLSKTQKAGIKPNQKQKWTLSKLRTSSAK